MEISCEPGLATRVSSCQLVRLVAAFKRRNSLHFVSFSAYFPLFIADSILLGLYYVLSSCYGLVTY